MSKKGKGKKGKKSSTKASAGVGDTLKNSVTAVADEIEKAGGVVLGEIRNSFEFVGEKVADTARITADTTVAVKDKVTSKEVTDQLHGLVTDVEEVGESLLKTITRHFESLRKSIAKSSKKAQSKAKSKEPMKPTTRKKAVSGKTAAKKKTTARKTTVRKKPVAKKKAATRKKTTQKKPVAKKKAATRKKTTQKKPVTRKPAARTATTRKRAAARKRVY